MRRKIRYVSIIIFLLYSSGLSAQHFYHSLAGDGTFSNVKKYIIRATGKTVPAIWYNGNGRLSVTIFMEKKDGDWAEVKSTANVTNSTVSGYPISFGHYNAQNIEDTWDIFNVDNFVVCYYDRNLGEEYSYDCPSPAEIKKRFGKAKITYSIFCVAEDKKTGSVFVSQCFNIAQSTPFDKVLEAFKAHMKEILKDNAALGIPYEHNGLNFWIECKSRGYSRPAGKGAHLGMDYPQIVDFSASCISNEKVMNESRDGFIRFKNDFGDMDLVYLIDFDYNKVKH